MSAIWSPSRRKLIWQPPVPRPLAKWLRAHEVAGIYQTIPGGRWDALRGKLQAVTTVARTAGLCPAANSYNVTVAVPGQDVGAVWFAQVALDNASNSVLAAALYSAENYTNQHLARIGWDDYSTNVLNFYFKYSSYSAVSQNVTLAAGKRVAGIAMYVDAAEVTCFVDGVEVASAAQTATLAATHYAFTGTSPSGQHVSRYGDALQSKGTACAGSLFGPKALARELSRNPWMAFAPRDPGVVMVSAAGGATAVAADFSSAYALRGAVTADAAAAFVVRGAVAADASAAYALRAPASADAAAGFDVRDAVAADLGAAYEIQATEPVAADLGADYLVRGAVSADAAATYALRGAVAADAGAAYALRAAVSIDAACAFVVRGAVAADEVAAYVLRGSVARDLSAAYTVDGSAESVAVISAPRTRGVVPGMTRRAASAGRRPAQRSTSRRPT